MQEFCTLSRVLFKRDVLSIKLRIANHPTPRAGHTDPLESFKSYKPNSSNTQLFVRIPGLSLHLGQFITWDGVGRTPGLILSGDQEKAAAWMISSGLDVPRALESI